MIVTKVEPPDRCAMVGGFFTYQDCLNGMGTGNTDEDAQVECMKWKAGEKHATHAVIDAVVGDGYYKGRLYRCPQ